MTPRARAILDLVRVPNLFTAAADSIAGYFLAGGSMDKSGTWALVGTASMLLYAGGVALNDVCDVSKDAGERPHRPIPSGAITRGGALKLATFLLIFGTGIASGISIASGATALLLVISIVAYDAVLKPYAVAPLLMGLCRALNLALGVQAAGEHPFDYWIALGVLLLYVASLTFFARHEASISRRLHLVAGLMGMVSAALGTALVARDDRHPAWFVGVIGLVIIITWSGRAVLRDPGSSAVQGAVKRLVLCIVGIDTLFAASVGWWQGLIVLSLVVPAAWLANRHTVT